MVAVLQKTNEGKRRLDYGGAIAKTLATSQNTSPFLETSKNICIPYCYLYHIAEKETSMFLK